MNTMMPEPQELRDMLQQCRDWLYAAYHRTDSLTAEKVKAALPNIDKTIATLRVSQVETYTEICMNEKCPRGCGTPVEIVRK